MIQNEIQNEIPSDKYRKSHCGDKMIIQLTILPLQWDFILRWYFHIESGPRILLSLLAYSWWQSSGIDSSFFNSWQTQAVCTGWPLPPTCKLTVLMQKAFAEDTDWVEMIPCFVGNLGTFRYNHENNWRRKYTTTVKRMIRFCFAEWF